MGFLAQSFNLQTERKNYTKEIILRKPMSKKLRFEVLKRDSFTCQYCGQSAPNVVLNVDHIEPVAKGGTNSIINLITSCFDCNSGKKDRKLDDNSILSKQINQTKMLSEKTEQLKLMQKWQKSLINFDQDQLNLIKKHINQYLNKANSEINEDFLNTDIKKSLKKYGFKLLTESIETSAMQYLTDVNSNDDRNKFLDMISKICYWKNQEFVNPELSEIRKLAFAAKKKWWKCYPNQLTTRLKELRDSGWEINELSAIIYQTTGIMQFEDKIKLLAE